MSDAFFTKEEKELADRVVLAWGEMIDQLKAEKFSQEEIDEAIKIISRAIDAKKRGESLLEIESMIQKIKN